MTPTPEPQFLPTRGFQPLVPWRDPFLPRELAGLSDNPLLPLRKSSRGTSQWRRACCDDLTAFSQSFQVRHPRVPGGAGKQSPTGWGVGDDWVPQCIFLVPTDMPLLVRGGRTGRGLERLRLLDTYARALLATSDRVSQSPMLTGFFAPQPLDLEPALPPGRCFTHTPLLPALLTCWQG
jgi:hypothetical protein